MKELLDKLSSYNIFNYLLPGVLFVVLLNNFTSYSFFQENLLIEAFIYYFIGLIVSRFGSLFIEPFLKKVKFLKFANYKNFIIASRKDPKIEILSEVNNMYRTLSSVFILLLILKLYEIFSYQYQITNWNMYIVIILLSILFLYSYRKQTQYIKKRINMNIDEKL